MTFQKSSPRILASLGSHLLGLGIASAAVTYVDPPDILIPANFSGVYLDLDTSSLGGNSLGSAQPASYTLSYGEPASWDLNFFFGGAGVAYSDTLNPYIADPGNRLSALVSLGLAGTINGTTPLEGALPLATPGFGGSGSGIGGDSGVGAASGDHMGTAAGQFDGTTNDDSYIAFILDPGTATPNYGWIRVTLNEDGNTGVIHDWAYSDQPLAVGAIPEPTTTILGLLGLAGLWIRRRE